MNPPLAKSPLSRRLLGAVIVAAVSALVLWQFHDRAWWPPDEGAYAHVAERILDGETLNGDVQDVHMGYINFANALAFQLFGRDLVSLRYPLVALGVVGAVVAYLLFAGRGTLVAATAAMLATAFSAVMFLNPTAHWYCLTLFLLTAGWLHWRPPGSLLRWEVAGLLIGACLMFRQLSGVLLGMGAVAWLLIEAPQAEGTLRTLVGRLTAAAMGLGLLWYLAAKTDMYAIGLYGVWPLGILATLAVRPRIANGRAALALVRLAGGGLAAAAPLIVYHASSGSLVAWLDDTVFAAMALTRLDFFSVAGYPLLIAGAGANVARFDSVPAVANGFFWLAALLAPAGLGLYALGKVTGRKEESSHEEGAVRPARIEPLPLLAAFYSIVALHYQIPIYLAYTLAPVLLALLWVATTRNRWLRPVAVAAGVCMAATALIFHAGQPLSRGLDGTLAGKTTATAASGIAGCSLSIEPYDARLYGELLALIERETSPGDAILALPSNAELYFLARRRNPCRFFNSAIGIRDESELEATVAAALRDPPRLLFHRADDKYNNDATRALMERLRPRYELILAGGGFEVYRLKRPGETEVAGP